LRSQQPQQKVRLLWTTTIKLHIKLQQPARPPALRGSSLWNHYSLFLCFYYYFQLLFYLLF
jgi:hypothetical protein